MKVKLYRRQISVLMLLFSFFSFCSLFAQIEGTKIKDGTISTGPEKARAGVLLELESNNKGVLLPRLTTAQRDAILPANITPGLMIFNTNTACFDYWSDRQNLWVSLCGSLPPAVYDISAAQCSKAEIFGTYKQGVPLNQSNYMTLTVTVTQRGNYTIFVTPSSGSGYYFATSGLFISAGTYVLYLTGMGTPNKGYPGSAGDPGDSLRVLLDGALSSCSLNNWVEEADVDFVLNCGSTSILGNYFQGVPLTASNKITLNVNPTTVGFWSINTNTVNGYSFSGTGTFDNLTPNQTVELLGTGTPTASGVNNFNISSNAVTLATGTCPNIPVTVSSVGYTIDCSTATPNGTYTQDVALSSSNTITLPINVTATGQTTISTNTVNGISYTSGLINLSALGAQNIILTGSGTPATSGNTSLTVTGAPGGAATCSVNVPVTTQPVTYTTNCGGITTAGNYAPGIAMNASNTMTVPVNVTYVGAYSITTNTVNGISFSASGTFASTGAQNVVLGATGTPLSGGTFSYAVTANSTNGGTACNKSINFVFRTMKVLGLGSGVYQPGSAAAGDVARAVLASTANFGPTGTFQVQGITIVNGGFNTGATLKNSINSNNIDIIVVGYYYSADAATIAVLDDFVKNKKGVLIFADKSYGANSTGLINTICSSTTVALTGTGATYTNPILNVADPVLDGPFGNIKGKYTGSEWSNAVYATGLPSNTTALVTQTGNTSRVWAFKHNTLGFMFVGEGAWIGGNATDTATFYYPAKVTATGLPVPKPYSDGISVQNSIMYANAMVWAIKYAQENVNTSYVIP